MSIRYDVRLVSAMEKVLPSQSPEDFTDRTLNLSGWYGETVSFQLAWRSYPQSLNDKPQLRVKIMPCSDALDKRNEEVRREKENTARAGVTPKIDLYQVGLVPCALPKYSFAHSSGYLVDVPGLLPDILQPLQPQGSFGTDLDDELNLTQEYLVADSYPGWNCLWVDVTLPCAAVKICVYTAEGDKIFTHTEQILNVPHELNDARFVFTQWFHADTLARFYNYEMWSLKHWKAIEQGMHSAARMGVNSLLTPVWTPPVDTVRGSYRELTQLLDISRINRSKYVFETQKLDKWLNLLERTGIRYVEIPHFFTQWGAERAAHFQIVETSANVGLKKEFGWHTKSTDPEYIDFLHSLIPFLKSYFQQNVGLDHVLFHIADEPTVAAEPTYRQAISAVMPLLAGCRVVDAVSDPRYGKTGQTPVVATSAVHDFRSAGMEPEWVYYCCAQYDDVSNRFIAQAPVRTRGLGWQLYKNRARGLMHWGFNFYASELSKYPINPYVDTTGGGAFPGGDPFVVYPGKDGDVIESLRHRYIRQSMNDLAVAQRAEKLLGVDLVRKIIDPAGDLDYDSGWCDGYLWQKRRYELDRECSRALQKVMLAE